MRLAIVVLRSNQLCGGTPSNMSHLQYLQLLDLSTNLISGNIPICVGNFTEMRKTGSVVAPISYSYTVYNGSDVVGTTTVDDKVETAWKGTQSNLELLWDL